jgi:murein DD-endopeptidase MepM/ murein hydrolase activator NlpD
MAQGAASPVNMGEKKLPITDQLKAVGKSAVQLGKDMGNTGSATSALGTATKTLALNMGSASKSLAVSAFTAGKSMIAGMGPMLAISAAIMLATKAFTSYKDNQARGGNIEGLTDANKNYNNFAESAGLATRSLLSLAEAAKISTSTLNKKNTTDKDALEITQQELANTQNPEYKNAMGDISSKESAMGLASRIRGLVGDNNPEALAQAMSDVADTRGLEFQKQVAKAYQQNAESGKSGYEIGLQGVDQSLNAMGGSSDRSVAAMQNVQGELTRNIQDIVNVYGESARGMSTQAEAEKFLAAVNNGNFGYLNSNSKEVTSTLKELGFTVSTTNSTKLARDGKELSPVSTEGLKYGAQETANYRTAKETESRLAAAKGNPTYTGNRDEIGRASSSALALADALNAAENAAYKAGTTVTGMSNTVKDAQDPLTKSAIELAKAPNSIKAQTAAGAEYAKVFRENNKSVAETIANLNAQLSTMSESDYRRGGIQSAIQQLQMNNINSAGKPMMQRAEETMRAAAIAQAAGPSDNAEAERARLAEIQAGKDAQMSVITFTKQFLEAKRNLDIQSQRQSEQAGRQAARTQRDFNIQVKQTQEDFIKSRKRQAEDLAKTVFSPFERISVVRTADAYSTVSNLQAGNTSLKKQMDNVKKLKKLGLSQQAIDTMDLFNPANAQQVERLLMDMQQNLGLVTETNAAAAERNKLTKQYTESNDNVSNRRAVEDLNKQMKRGREAMKRGLNDMYTDLSIAKTQALEDLARMGDEIETTGEGWNEALTNAVAELPASAQSKLSNNIKTMMGTLSVEFDKEFNSKFGGMGITTSDLGKNWALSSKVATLPTEGGQGSGDSGGWGGAGPSYSLGLYPLKNQLGSGSASLYATGGKGRFTAPWKMKGDWLGGYHHGHDIAANAGTSIQSTVLGKVEHMGGNGPESGWAGNYVQLEMLNGKKIMFAHMSAVDGSVKSEFEKNKKDGKDTYVNRGEQIGRVGSTGRSTGPHVHIEVRDKPYGDNNAIDPRVYMATGGIVSQATNAVVGEAGAEAVIPLNYQGANVLADAMVRYVNSSDVLASRVQPYATSNSQSYNHTQYDQSTQINGPITVESNDPAEFARKMQMRQRRQRLLQPIGN